MSHVIPAAAVPAVPVIGAGADASFPVHRIYCVGRNYVEHAREMNNPVPAEPLLFLKAPSSIVGPRAPVVLPLESQQVEYEGEIAVVLRERLRRADADAAARAARQRQQQAASEFECMMKRQQRQNHIAALERENSPEHHYLRGEITVR